ncbi:MAG: c-type cytochrome [Pseudomonadota bacterium]
MRFLPFFAAVWLAVAPASADLTGDPEAGESKALVCGACHGADGNSISAEWPSLAGQHAQYIVARLKAYKNGDVNNAVMGAQVLLLSEQDMHDLGAYFETLTIKPGEADPSLVDAGAALYRLGNPDTHVASCAACHGPKGRGNPTAMMPSLAGQRATYTIAQLNAFASGDRPGGINNMMHDVASKMSDEEKQAVASFLEGLH